MQLQPQQVYLQSHRLIEDVFASSFDSKPANNLEGIITNVIDGDSLDIRTDDVDVMTIRLSLVDAPEMNELGHNEAKGFLSQSCLDKPVTIDPDNNQGLSYGRLVALVYCDDLNINEAIIASGFADIYKSFCTKSEFGNSSWAQKYGCDADDVELFNSRVMGETDTISDNVQEEKSIDCDSAYPDVCISSSPPDLNCGDISVKNFKVKPADPHNFDGDSDGIGCET